MGLSKKYTLFYSAVYQTSIPRSLCLSMESVNDKKVNRCRYSGSTPACLSRFHGKTFEWSPPTTWRRWSIICKGCSQSKVTHACTPVCRHSFFCLATSQDHSTISVDDGCKIQRGYFAVANCSTLRGLFFLPVMGKLPHCISFKRNYYKEDLLQVREWTQVPTMNTNVFAVSFSYTTFVAKDFAITARSGNGARLYSPR